MTYSVSIPSGSSPLSSSDGSGAMNRPGIDAGQRVHLSMRDGRALQPVSPARRIIGPVPALTDPFPAARDDHRTDRQPAREKGLMCELQAP
jgi:hypothetical protein